MEHFQFQPQKPMKREPAWIEAIPKLRGGIGLPPLQTRDFNDIYFSIGQRYQNGSASQTELCSRSEVVSKGCGEE